MRFLRSTDFSPMSKIAIQYAVDLKKDIEPDIALLHVADTSTPTRGRFISKGVSCFKIFLTGSNATSIIENSSIPVITILEYAKYKGVNIIVYSSDLQNQNEELESIISFAKMMNTWVYIIHIEQKKEDFDEDFLKQKKRLRPLFSFKKIKVKELKDISVVQGFIQYVKNLIEAEKQIIIAS
jgi:hypothetical protein